MSAARGPAGRRWMAGAGLLVIGAGLLLAASGLGGATLSQPRAAAPVNAGARDGTDPRAQNSPGVATDPKNAAYLAVVARVDSPEYSCSLHVSSNGGTTWRESQIPFPAGEELPARCFAPDVVFDAGGTLYLSFVTLKGLGNSPNAVWTTSSTDGGRTLATPVRALGPLAFQVRIAADAARPGALYMTWLQADAVAFVAFPNPSNPVRSMRSTDGGVTWTAPRDVSSAGRQRVAAPSLAPGRGNELYVLYLELVDDRLDYEGGHGWMGGDPYPGPWRLVLARSADRGDSWKETVVERGLIPTQRMLVFLPPTPSLAVDSRRGRVFVAFQDGRRGDADVLLWTSTDRGASFSAPHKVNDTTSPDGTAQYLPRLAVAPSGRLDVMYYDRRGDRKDVKNQVSMQSSADGGRTFGPHRLLSTTAFDSTVGFGGSRGMPDLGSRLGLVSDDDRVIALWSDTRRGTPDAVRQDVALAVVDVAGASTLGAPLRVAGVLAAAAGLVVLVLELAGSRRRPPVRTGSGWGREPGAANAGVPPPGDSIDDVVGAGTDEG